MLNDYFSFTKKERNGVVMLFSLILTISFLPKIYASLYPKSSHLNYKNITSSITKWDSLKTQSIKVALFDFDPNFASKEDFLRLGLSKKVASNIVNYRNKGGKFYKKEDFKKIWNLEEADYRRVLPYITISISNNYDHSDNSYASKYESRPSIPSQLFSFDPNTATKEDFINLGLPERTANNIVKYRNKGAKFYKKEDFKKIWNLKEADYERLSSYITINNIPKEYDNDNYNNTSKSNSKYKSNVKAQTFPFDPNTATKEDFIKLGLSEKIANNIVKYRKKGATFETKTEFKKVWGISEEDFNRLAPHIKIVVKMVDINTATAADFKELRGIGESLSSRIIKFRNQLGGFTSIDQLSTMYGLEAETFAKIKPRLKRTNTKIKKININTATVDQLKAHPYIKWKEANLIIQYREQHGDYKDIKDIMEIRAFKQAFFDKVKDYLMV